MCDVDFRAVERNIRELYHDDESPIHWGSPTAEPGREFGFYVCLDCDGIGTVPCPLCGGRGCSDCTCTNVNEEGRGYIEHAGVVPCPGCGGNLVQGCESCDEPAPLHWQYLQCPMCFKAD